MFDKERRDERDRWEEERERNTKGDKEAQIGKEGYEERGKN